MNEFLGHAITDGEVNYFSVSSLEKASPRDSGCFRRYWYRYVGGKSAEEKTQNEKAKASGDALHLEIKNYYRTGEMVLSGLVMRGMHFMPPRGDDLLIERSLHTVQDGVIHSPLTAAGIPVIGYIDLAHARGLNYGTDDPNDYQDPPGTVELLDWKWKGDVKDRHGNSKIPLPGQLVQTIQMSGYGMWARNAAKAEHVRLSHGIFPAKGGQPRKVTKLHVVDDCERTWQYVEGVARSVKDIVKETIAERVEPNLKACDAYGGCPMRGFCKAYETNSLSSLFGESAAMGLIEQLGGQPAPAPAVDQRAALLQEEQQLRAAQPAQQALLQQVAPQPMPVHPIAAAWQYIKNCRRGAPALGGAAARDYASACGYQFDGTGYAGTSSGQPGSLHTLTLFETAHIEQLARELGYQGPSQQYAAAMTQAYQSTSVDLLPPDAPQSIPALATKGEAPAEPAPTPVEPRKRGPGRPKKSSGTTTVVAAGGPPLASPPVAPAPQAAVAVPDTIPSEPSPSQGELQVFVDCIPNGDFVSLHPYIDKLCGVLTKRYCVGVDGKPTSQDVRLAPKDGPLGYGKGGAAVRALAIEVPPPDATYVVFTRGNEIAGEVADAMREICTARGTLFVKGV